VRRGIGRSTAPVPPPPRPSRRDHRSTGPPPPCIGGPRRPAGRGHGSSGGCAAGGRSPTVEPCGQPWPAVTARGRARPRHPAAAGPPRGPLP
jgi:hypothetical protein